MSEDEAARRARVDNATQIDELILWASVQQLSRVLEWHCSVKLA